MGIFSPWVIYFKKASALFADDDDVSVTLADGPSLVVRVRGADKAESISELMPEEMQFGNVTMGIEVVPDNSTDMSVADHLRRAFAGNVAFCGVESVDASGFSATYAMFAPTVVQYSADSLASPYGLVTMTMEDVARDVLALPDGVFASSEVGDSPIDW